MFLLDPISQVKINLPEEFFWGIIASLLGLLGWIGAKYFSRLETILERLDTAIEGINHNQTLMGEQQKNHENRITKLEEANKAKRR